MGKVKATRMTKKSTKLSIKTKKQINPARGFNKRRCLPNSNKASPTQCGDKSRGQVRKQNKAATAIQPVNYGPKSYPLGILSYSVTQACASMSFDTSYIKKEVRFNLTPLGSHDEEMSRRAIIRASPPAVRIPTVSMHLQGLTSTVSELVPSIKEEPTKMEDGDNEALKPITGLRVRTDKLENVYSTPLTSQMSPLVPSKKIEIPDQKQLVGTSWKAMDIFKVGHDLGRRLFPPGATFEAPRECTPKGVIGTRKTWIKKGVIRVLGTNDKFGNKKARKRIKKEEFVQRLNRIKTEQVEAKAAEERQKTAIVGDLKPMSTILEQMEIDIKQEVEINQEPVEPTENPVVRSKKQKFNVKTREKQFSDSLLYFECKVEENIKQEAESQHNLMSS